MGTFFGLATSGIIFLNLASAWVSWATNLPRRFGPALLPWLVDAGYALERVLLGMADL
jgi:hypothetical protein